MRRTLLLGALVIAACSSAAPEPDGLAPIPTPPRHTPRWAFEPWISKDISTTADTRDFVQGFIDRHIPVGAVVIDSPWMSQYTTFIPSPSRYPDFGPLIAELHAKGVRLVVWTTQMINESSYDLEMGGDKYEGPSPNYYEAKGKGYMVNDGQTYLWWKGVGGGLDFMNPEARRWWHRQQDPLFALGLDGYKLDFGENYVRTPTIATQAGVIDHQAYSEEYYRDFLAYGVQERGRDFLTMVRPWDESYDFPGRFYAKKETAPVAWVGDNRRDWFGFVDALDSIFRSAAAGYVVLGSDIGGYLDRNDIDITQRIPFDTAVLWQWTSAATWTPFFQLHGRANLTPWTVPERADEYVALYRYAATLHHELVPYFYSLAEEAYAGGPVILSAVAGPERWKEDPRFLSGPAFLVAPSTAAVDHRMVSLPSDARWLAWSDLDGPFLSTTASVATPVGQVPVFLREGAIVPLASSSTVTALGMAGDSGPLLLVVPGPATTRFVLHATDDTTVAIEAETTAGVSHVRLSRLVEATVLAVRREGVTRVEINGAAASGLVQRGARTWVRLEPSAGPLEITLQ
ncbi:MAG: glycoside hydrolase family 31 protein [Myxococcota bacterium]